MTALIIAGVAVILVAAFIIPLVSRGQRYHWPRPHEPVITRHLAAEAERLALYGPDWPGAWPADLCAYPPCSPEDRWVCDQHQHQPQPEPGKHRLGSSQSRGHDVIQAVVTDLPDPWDSRWTR